METGFLRHARTLAGPRGGDLVQGYCPSTCPSTWERKRSRGPLPALRRRSPEALAGGRWLGGGLLSVSAEADEAVVVEGDRPTSQAAWTVSGGCTSTWIAWLFCSSISFAAFSTSSARVVRYDLVRWSTTPWTIVTTM